MKKTPPFAIALHGGASNIKKLNLTPEQELAYKTIISMALDTGYAILQNGGSSVDAVYATVKVLEDAPLFNAGRGSVFTRDGTIEMDAAIMDGKTLDCGAVAGVRHIKNPVEAARAIMLNSGFVLLSEEGAEQFAREHGVQMADTAYFETPFRRAQWEKFRHRDTTVLDNDSRGEIQPLDENAIEKYGTVGCVALDQKGNLAAATSTGGIVNKQYHRIGDSPLIGAGTYADNRSCAISCTGKGEDFIRLLVAHEIASLVRYRKLSIAIAARQVIHHQLKGIGGRGGCIVMDKTGNITLSFNTSGMFRGKIDKYGRKSIGLYKTQKRS